MNTRTIEVTVVNAFGDGDSSQSGNPAAVVLDADDLDPDQMQALAKAAGLSETAFLSSSDVADYRLDFFTPTRRIAHCGHATIAAFGLLAQLARIQEGWYSKETVDGTRRINIRGHEAFMEQSSPSYVAVKAESELLGSALGVAATQIIGDPMLVNTGNSFVVVQVDSAETLASIQPDQPAIAGLSEQLDLIGIYVFCRQVNQPGRHASARMFAPRYGIEEEAATGMAAGPLACYLRDVLKLEGSRFLIEQGYHMSPASPSMITVELDIADGRITSLMAGGRAVIARTLQLEIK